MNSFGDADLQFILWRYLSIVLGRKPLPGVPVRNEGLVRDPPLNMKKNMNNLSGDDYWEGGRPNQ